MSEITLDKIQIVNPSSRVQDVAEEYKPTYSQDFSVIIGQTESPSREPKKKSKRRR